MLLDLTHLSRMMLGDGPSIDHYYQRYREDDGSLTLTVVLRHDQSIKRHWLRQYGMLVDMEIHPSNHRDQMFLNYLKREN